MGSLHTSKVRFVYKTVQLTLEPSHVMSKGNDPVWDDRRIYLPIHEASCGIIVKRPRTWIVQIATVVASVMLRLSCWSEPWLKRRFSGLYLATSCIISIFRVHGNALGWKGVCLYRAIVRWKARTRLCRTPRESIGATWLVISAGENLVRSLRRSRTLKW